MRADDGTELSGLIDSTVPGARAVAVFPPSAVAVHVHPLTGSPRNVIRDRVAALEPNGTMVRVRGPAGLAADITPAAAVELELRSGCAVWLEVKAVEVAVYPPQVAASSRPATG